MTTRALFAALVCAAVGGALMVGAVLLYVNR